MRNVFLWRSGRQAGSRAPRKESLAVEPFSTQEKNGLSSLGVAQSVHCVRALSLASVLYCSLRLKHVDHVVHLENGARCHRPLSRLSLTRSAALRLFDEIFLTESRNEVDELLADLEELRGAV